MNNIILALLIISIVLKPRKSLCIFAKIDFLIFKMVFLFIFNKVLIALFLAEKQKRQKNMTKRITVMLDNKVKNISFLARIIFQNEGSSYSRNAHKKLNEHTE